MIKVAPPGLITALLLAVASSLPAAKVDAQTSEQIDSLISMVRELQQLVADQALRISSLEEALRALERRAQLPTARPLSRQPTLPEVTRSAVETNPSGRPGWHLMENWERIRTGMTYEEVVAILGPPTTIRGGYSLRTLQYQGEVPGSGFLRGDIGIYGDANTVFRIKRPAF